ncbi:MAG: ABC transporter ATP-binding protein, partial [Mesorhizobium sp.]
MATQGSTKATGVAEGADEDEIVLSAHDITVS